MIKEKPNLITNELINLLRQLDNDTFLHGMRVGEMLYKFSRYLNLSLHQSNQLQLIGYIHDIGKLYIPKSIISKRGPLTDQEWNIMKIHAFIGFNLLKDILNQKEILNAVRYHHENIDGTGYEGLIGEQVDFYSRLVRIVDSFDALTNDRCYQNKCSIERALKKIQKLSGAVYDKELVNEFTKFIFKNHLLC
ncbi:HD-GYP domain-containing protein [Gottfriedia luciferensis]|uniref:HD-GYP domain-containing protein n=1 Tax=Gottfriedia luciferensis TaxID=178774 RepID=UPI000B43F0F6|nr:HD domain-containing phosphohydrolase [Gottfriedia luciferensis]